MAQKLQKETILKKVEQRFPEYSHWVFACGPLIASILATLFKTNTHILEFIFIVLAIIANFIILRKRSKTEENKELSLFDTFLTNNLPPNRSGEELLFNTEVAIIEDEGRAYFEQKLEKKFQHESKADDENGVLAKDEKLRFRLVPCASLDKDGIDKDDQERIIADLKRDLKNALSNSEAVVIVRTEELEKDRWVYDAVEEWAKKNSEVPILFVRPKDRKNYKKHEIADGYYWIPDDPKSLPWRLLKRAKDRAFAWRTQAGFNRAMVANIFYLSLMFIYLTVFWVVKKQEELQNEKRNHDTVIQNEKKIMTPQFKIR